MSTVSRVVLVWCSLVSCSRSSGDFSFQFPVQTNIVMGWIEICSYFHNYLTILLLSQEEYSLSWILLPDS